MKIAFCGAGGVGKTTLAKELAKDLGLSFVPSVSRQVFQEFGWTEDRQRTATPEENWKLQRTIFERRILRDQGLTEGVADRSLLDHLSYCYLRCDQALDAAIIDLLEEQTRKSLKELTILFYVPLPTWRAPSDGMREDGMGYRVHYDAIMRGLIDKLRQPIVVLKYDDHQVRMRWIMHSLSYHGVAGKVRVPTHRLEVAEAGVR